MQKTLFLVLAACFLISGCAHKKTLPQDPALTVPDPVSVTQPAPASPGSLWSSGQTGLFVDNKARTVGDLLTVAIYETSKATRAASTTTGRKSDMSAGITAMFGVEKNIGNLNSSVDPKALISSGYSNEFQGSGSSSRSDNLVATLTVQVIEVLPTGNLRIAGAKNVIVNNEDQYLRLTGVVRASDISADNTINSRSILNAQIAYSGKGVISDKQSPGWLVRVLDNVWPF